MPSLSDMIERYIIERLAEAPTGSLVIQRSELSEIFGCSPSQINYVLETRFTETRGYLVESRRGGAGYLRIIRLNAPACGQMLDLLERYVGECVNQERAEQLVERLSEDGLLTERETVMMRAALDRQILVLALPQRDLIRARLIKAMLLSLFRPGISPPGNGEQATGSGAQGG